MKPTAISNNLIRTKNRLLLELEEVRKTTRGRRMFALASEVASLEGQVAYEYLRLNRFEDAAVSFISQASCLLDARREVEARRILIQSREFTQRSRLLAWITQTLGVLSDKRLPAIVFSSAHPHIADNDSLRRPQKEAYSAARDHFSRSNEHAIIQLPVGAGKTGAMAILPFDIARGRVLVVSPNLEIRGNLATNLDYSQRGSFLRRTGVVTGNIGPTCAQLDSDANLHDCDASDIVVTNIQQLAAGQSQKWLSKLSPDYFDMIFLDEGHHNVAPTWKESVARFPTARVVSFTATPFRADGQKVEGQRIYRFPIAEAIREGYIKDIASRRLEPSEIYFTYRDDEYKHTLAEVLRLRDQDWFSKGVALAPECNAHIVDASIQCMNQLREEGKSRHQIIASACSIDHAKSVRSLYEERNIRAEVLHSGLEASDQDRVRKRIREGDTDAVVQVFMLGEGADYPTLSVAAVLRPYRHFVPYFQFIGRVMRVIEQNRPGHPDNRGFIISHVGLNIDRWWEELRQLDQDDQQFFQDVAYGARVFITTPEEDTERRRRFRPDMQVIQETISHFIQERFLPEDTRARVDDLVTAMAIRGIDIESLGLSREQLQEKLQSAENEYRQKGSVEQFVVSPQKARQQARKRLDERVRAASKQLLNDLSLRVTGYELPKLFPRSGATNNIATAIILLNLEIQEYLQAGSAERDLMTDEQLKKAYGNIDEIIDRVVAKVKARKGGK